MGRLGGSSPGSTVGTPPDAGVMMICEGSARVHVAVGDGIVASSVLWKLSQLTTSTARRMTRNQIRAERAEGRCSGMQEVYFSTTGIVRIVPTKMRSGSVMPFACAIAGHGTP